MALFSELYLSRVQLEGIVFNKNLKSSYTQGFKDYNQSISQGPFILKYISPPKASYLSL